MRSRTAYFWIFFVVALCALLEGLSYLSLSFLERTRGTTYLPADRLTEGQIQAIDGLIHGRTDYTVYSSTLGWTVKPGGSSSLYRANSQGLRAYVEYDSSPPPGVLRISTFGNSFTHCHDVTNQDTWQSIIIESAQDVEVLNFGVGAYGLDQTYLRYREEAPRFKSHVVIIGFMSDCPYRNVNVFRPFLSPRAGLPLAKPRFALKDAELVLLPNPMSELEDYSRLLADTRATLSELGKNDVHYKARYKSGPLDALATVRFLKMALAAFKRRTSDAILVDGRYDAGSEAYRVTIKTLEKFHSEVLRDGSLPIVAIFPTKEDVIRFTKTGERKYGPLLSYLDANGYRYIDLLDVLAGASDGREAGELVAEHYTPLANRLVAESIAEYLREHGLTNPAAVRAATAGRMPVSRERRD